MARILAVDDERAILDALARVLGRDGGEHADAHVEGVVHVPFGDISR